MFQVPGKKKKKSPPIGSGGLQMDAFSESASPGQGNKLLVSVVQLEAQEQTRVSIRSQIRFLSSGHEQNFTPLDLNWQCSSGKWEVDLTRPILIGQLHDNKS